MPTTRKYQERENLSFGLRKYEKHEGRFFNQLWNKQRKDQSMKGMQ